MKTIRVGCISTPELRESANVAAAELGISLSEYMRMALIHLAKERSNPFRDGSNMRRGRPPVQVSL